MGHLPLENVVAFLKMAVRNLGKEIHYLGRMEVRQFRSVCQTPVTVTVGAQLELRKRNIV